MTNRFDELIHLKTFRWSFMLAALFWTIVYRLSSANVGLPDFVYVNF